MPKASMGGFGVIKMQALDTIKTGLPALARLLDYPEAEILSPEFMADLSADFPAVPEKAAVIEAATALQQFSLEDLRAHYVGLFELNNRYTLYMTYYKLTDSRERGQLLARLKMLYEMFGVQIEGTELPDYLPLMLEFLAYSRWQDDERKQDLKLLFAVIEDGTYELLTRAKTDEADPYFALVRAVRSMFAACVEKAEVAAHD